jgi:hypothetical protein
MSFAKFARIICVFLLISVPALAAQAAETPTIATPAAVKTVHRVHSLADFGDDPHIGLWLAKTIGEVIAPGTWDADAPGGEKRILRYFAPGKILVVAHTAAVQAEVEAFLRSVKQSLPMARPTAPPPPIVGTPILRTQNLVPGVPLTDLPSIEVVPKTARHMFHLSIDGFESKTSDSGEGSETKFRNFTLRYEGDGLLDLAELAKNVNVKTGSEAPPSIPSTPELPPAPKVEESKGPEPAESGPQEKEAPGAPLKLPKIEHTETPPETLPPGAPNEEELLPMPMLLEAADMHPEKEWTSLGTLRSTTLNRDGQKVYLLEIAGKPELFVTPTGGWSLRDFVGKTVCFYGTVSSEEYSPIRAQHMLAERVATFPLAQSNGPQTVPPANAAD